MAEPSVAAVERSNDRPQYHRVVNGPCGERFLFYRGVGTCPLPASVRLAGETVEVASAAEVGPVVLFERHGGLVGYRRQDLAGGEAFLERPVLGDSLAALRAELQQMLVERGLYPREAAAMLATWDESWFEEGLRLFYILPGPETDALLPLSIDPEPQEPNSTRALQ